ncbi:MAG: metallophosphoesterase [Butyrivibrio sp.]|nr:metallophosphoesterase [Butyrivibrio sp.]
MKKKIWRIIAIILLVIVAISLWFEVPVVERIDVDSEGKVNDPVRFALVTDLHSCYYGKDQNKLVEMIQKQDVDAVLLSGDIFDDKVKDDNSKIFLEHIVDEYPCFYVTGNHEFWSKREKEIKEYLASIGVTVLEGNYESFSVNGCTVDICGVDDPTYMGEDNWKKQLASALPESDNYKILLSHRPEKVDIYDDYSFDMIVSGHAHGGQWIIPFWKHGVAAPNQGLFPKYVDGMYNLSNGTKLVVSRGLSRERMPLPRFFNHPEVVVIEVR